MSEKWSFPLQIKNKDGSPDYYWEGFPASCTDARCTMELEIFQRRASFVVKSCLAFFSIEMFMFVSPTMISKLVSFKNHVSTFVNVLLLDFACALLGGIMHTFIHVLF